jgi:hypothetical protein
MYNFARICRHLAARLKPDGDSKVEIPVNPSIWINTDFGQEVARLIQVFTIDTRSLYSTKIPISVPIGTKDLHLTSPTCSKTVFEPHCVWISGFPIQKCDSLSALSRYDQEEGTPTFWAFLHHEVVRFNSTTDEVLNDCFVQGLYQHPEIQSDSVIVEGISTLELDLFSVFAEASLREGVASDGVGMDRLSRFDEKAYSAVLSLRSRNNRKVFGSYI